MYMLERYGKYFVSSSFSASSRPTFPTMSDPRASRLRRLNFTAPVSQPVLTHRSPDDRDTAMNMQTHESLPTAAARIGVSVKTIRRRIAEGVLPVYRCGRILRLDPDDVDAMFSRYPQVPRVSARARTAQRAS